MEEKNLNFPPEYYEDIPKEAFAYVLEKDGRLLDERFQTENIGFFKDALSRLKRHKAAIAAFWIICSIIVMAILGPMMTPYGFAEQHADYINMPPRIPALRWISLFDGSQVLKNRRLDTLNDTGKFPEGCILRVFNESEAHGVKMVDVEVDYYAYLGVPDDVNFWFGTDRLGRDIFTRLWRGTRISLIIAFVAVMADVCIGIVYGALAGYYGGMVDMILMRICEILRSLPNVVVVTLFIMLFGTGIRSMILALVVRGWIPTARMIRAQFLRFKNREYVMSARTMGVPDRKLIFRHILPNSIGPIITRTMMAIPGAIFTESFLAYIGLGIPAPEPSIGTMMSEGQATLLLYPTQTLFPAIVISVLMIAFNLFANGLRDAVNPTQRGVE